MSEAEHIFQTSQILRISFLDFPQLLYTAQHGIYMLPADFAEKHDLFIERSFEDGLGYYDFVGFQKGEYHFGMRMLISNPKKGLSFVSVLGAADGAKKLLISQAFDLSLGDVVEFEHDDY